MTPEATMRFAGLRAAAARRHHGTHARYVGGCRCLTCRAAHSRYTCERERAVARGEANGIVSAAPARRHVLALARKGVGYKAVAAAASVAPAILLAVKNGRRQRMRAQAVQRVLAVDGGAIADHALVASGATWRLLDELLAGGYSKAQIARWLGYRMPAIQIKRGGRITALTASKVERVYRMVQDGRLARTVGPATPGWQAKACPTKERA